MKFKIFNNTEDLRSKKRTLLKQQILKDRILLQYQSIKMYKNKIYICS